MIRLGALALVALSAIGGCRASGPNLGTSLDVGAASGTRLRSIPVGNEHIYLLAGFRNISDDPVEVRDVSLAKAAGFDAVAEIVRLELAPLEPDGPTLGVYEMYPPAASGGDGCDVQPTSPVSGFRLGPDDKVGILVWVRAVAAGDYRIRSQTVIYEQDGERYEQSVPFEIEGSIEEGVADLEAFPRARHCGEVADLLPGWRLPRREGN